MTGASIGSTAVAFLKLGRLHFLFGGFLLHGLGVAIALYAGAPFNFPALVWGQVVITATQLMTHYANDYFDLEADRANTTPTNWSGGSRVLVDGMLPARTALLTAAILAITALIGNVIISFGSGSGIWVFLLLISAQLGAWFYSAPPLRLHSRGLGELTTMITVTLLTPLAGYVLQAGRVDALPILACMPLCCLQLAMLLAIEFPDAEGDRVAGKRTLVIRLGMEGAKRLYVVALCAAFVSLPVLVAAGLPSAVGVGAAALLPAGVWLLTRVQRGDWRTPQRWGGFAFATVALLIAFAAVEFAAFVLLIGTR